MPILKSENSTKDVPKFPAIHVLNYKGPAICIVSLVSIDAPYKVHSQDVGSTESKICLSES